MKTSDMDLDQSRSVQKTLVLDVFDFDAINDEGSLKKQQKSSLKRTSIKREEFQFFVSLVLMTLYSPMLLVIMIYQVKKNENPGFSKLKPGSFPQIALAFDLFWLFIVIFVPAIIAIFPNLGKKNFTYLFFPIIFLAIFNLSFFVLKAESENIYFLSETQQVLTLYECFLTASLSLVISVLFSDIKISRLKGVIIAVFLQLAVMWIGNNLALSYNLSRYDFVFYLLISGLIAFYFHYDLNFMIKKRKGVYESQDYFLGAVHLQTDIFFRFWRDFYAKNTRVVLLN